MDHLPALESAKAHGAVPYKCSKPYDGGSFLEYPFRENRPYMVPSQRDPSFILAYWRREQLHPTPNDELEDMFQRWLFFGLIHEFLGEFCTRDTFLRTQADGSLTVSTSKLWEVLDEWIESIQKASSSLTYDHLSYCLRIVSATLRSAGSSFDPSIKLSIASLGEAFELAAQTAFGIEGFGVSWRSITPDDYWTGRMQQSGWCPSQINVTISNCVSLQVSN